MLIKSSLGSEEHNEFKKSHALTPLKKNFSKHSKSKSTNRYSLQKQYLRMPNKSRMHSVSYFGSHVEDAVQKFNREHSFLLNSY